MAFWDPVTRLLREIRAILLRIEALLQKLFTGPTTQLGLAATVIDKNPREGNLAMPAITPITIDTTQNIQYTTAPADTNGNPTTPTLSWTTSDGTVLTITPSTDTLSALASSVAAGVATITATDPATGIFDSQEVTVNAVGPPPTATIGLVATVVSK